MVKTLPFIHQSDQVVRKANYVSAAEWRYQTQMNKWYIKCIKMTSLFVEKSSKPYQQLVEVSKIAEGFHVSYTAYSFWIYLIHGLMFKLITDDLHLKKYFGQFSEIFGNIIYETFERNYGKK